MLEWIGPDNRGMAVLYIASGTILLTVVVLLMLFARITNKPLNWYEQNLLDMSTATPHYVRCKPISNDADDESIRSFETDLVPRKQSRIVNVHLFSDKKENEGVLPKGDLSALFTVPKANHKSSSMFRSLHFSQIDRGLYPSPGCSQLPDSESSYDVQSVGGMGSVKMALAFDENLNLLTVSLKQAIDLNAKRQDGPPNPYLRVCLDIPSTTKKTPQQSKTYNHTSCPVMNDDFYFQVTGSVVKECRLEVTLFDYDQFSVDECIGYCWLTLGRLTLSYNTNIPTVFWAEVLPFEETRTGWGEMLFSLTYLSKAQRLTVNMLQARNLPVMGLEGPPAVCIRVTVLSSDKRVKRKKTSTKNSSNPQFNESLSFGIANNSLCDIILHFEVMHEYGTFGMGSKLLGKLELPLHKCKELWRAIIREEKCQPRWYSLDIIQ